MNDQCIFYVDSASWKSGNLQTQNIKHKNPPKMVAANARVDYRQNHFEFPVLTQIVGEPTYDLLRTVLNELKANA